MSADEQPSAVEQEQARQALEALRGIAPGTDTFEITVAGVPQPVRLPRAALGLFREVLANMASGQGVTVVPAHAELSTQQAAELLGVSRPHVIKLLHEGHIRYRLVGRHRRVLASSLLEYRRIQQRDSRSAGGDLVALSEAVGLY